MNFYPPTSQWTATCDLESDFHVSLSYGNYSTLELYFDLLLDAKYITEEGQTESYNMKPTEKNSFRCCEMYIKSK